MKEIQLTRGKVALVDDEDYDYLNKWKWHAQKEKNTYYAVRLIRSGGKRVAILMHRLILNTPIGVETDHRDRNGLNNRKENLRFCNNSQNQYNKVPWGKSKYKGVHFRRGKWEAYIYVNKRKIELGAYRTEVTAAKIRDTASKKYFGEFAYLNFQ